MWGQPRGHFYAATMQEGSALALNAGTDICCGNDYKVWLKNALEEGLTTEEALDRALVNAFTARFRLGEFDPPEKLPWHTFDANTLCSGAHAATALRAAEASMTLLRNEDGFLPLKKEKGKKLLVIGPNAIYRQLGSYSIGGYADTRVSVTPLAGIRELGESLGFSVEYAKGWHILDKPIEGSSRFPVLERAAEENGLGMEEYFDARTPEPVKELNRQLAARRAQRAQLPPPVPRHPGHRVQGADRQRERRQRRHHRHRQHLHPERHERLEGVLPQVRRLRFYRPIQYRFPCSRQTHHKDLHSPQY